jgi:hexosaminidase
MKRSAGIVLSLLVRGSLLPAQAHPALLPLPASLQWDQGRLRLDSTLSAAAPAFLDDRLRAGIGRTLARLEGRIGQPLSKVIGSGEATLRVMVTGAGEAVQSPEEDESYRLTVTGRGVTLEAPTVVGALHGMETLQQLVTGDSTGFWLPAVTIADRPRFRWRGVLIDVGRHFMPVDMVRRTLDGMAAVKLNVLHFHLSEDQGFRVESRRYPKLSELGSDGLFYTQEEIRGLVSYARDRGIRIVPEFDMPGHSTSWFVGYPEYASAPGPYQIERRFGVFDPAFDPTREETYQFIEGFIAEMSQLFPDGYWHIGGDEVSPRQWNQNPRILRFKRTHGFKDNDALQAYFNGRLSRILAKYHRRMVGWDEILHDSLPAGTVVQSWRGTEYLGRAVRQGLSGILSAPFYLDHMDTSEQHYLADPLPPSAGLDSASAARILGGEACMWAEHVNDETVDSRLWPRLAAIAERFWSPANVRDIDDLYRRLALVSVHLERSGLSQEIHVTRMLHLLAGRVDIAPLESLLAVSMPATFGQRATIQHTTQRTPLTRLVDAARPDPWSRWQMVRLAREVVGGETADPTAQDALAGTFRGWKPLGDEVAAMVDSVPLAADGVPAARALGLLADLGLEALERATRGTATDAWRADALARLEALSQPQGLLRLAGVDAVRVLIEGKKRAGVS